MHDFKILKVLNFREVTFLTEEYKDGYTYGYTDNYLRIKVKKHLERGMIVKVKIESLEDLILIGYLL